jgi:hypothetical protein
MKVKRAPVKGFEEGTGARAPLAATTAIFLLALLALLATAHRAAAASQDADAPGPGSALGATGVSDIASPDPEQTPAVRRLAPWRRAHGGSAHALAGGTGNDARPTGLGACGPAPERQPACAPRAASCPIRAPPARQRSACR